MESDKRYFIEGLFIIALLAGMAFFFVWLSNSGKHDDVLYRIHFEESVSGLSLGDSVKFRGVDVGTVQKMLLDPDDPRRVQVDVRLRKEAPVKTDTTASLVLKGITGVVYVELDGGSPDAQMLAEVTPANQIPEIPSEKSRLTTLLDQLPQVIEKFSALQDQLPPVIAKFSRLEDQATKVVKDVEGVTATIKEDPSVLLRGPRKDTQQNPRFREADPANRR